MGSPEGRRGVRASLWGISSRCSLTVSGDYDTDQAQDTMHTGSNKRRAHLIKRLLAQPLTPERAVDATYADGV